MGVRTKILDSIREVHKKEWDVSSLQSKEKHILRWNLLFCSDIRSKCVILVRPVKS